MKQRMCHFLVWYGRIAVEYEELCTITGQFANTSQGKKRITARGFYFMD